MAFRACVGLPELGSLVQPCGEPAAPGLRPKLPIGSVARARETGHHLKTCHDKRALAAEGVRCCVAAADRQPQQANVWARCRCVTNGILTLADRCSHPETHVAIAYYPVRPSISQPSKPYSECALHALSLACPGVERPRSSCLAKVGGVAWRRWRSELMVTVSWLIPSKTGRWDAKVDEGV